ncbi:hypothetical protein GGI26_003540 [Coemansia sp. RSA 1358]|nr:hypothetical protein EDC05_004059 [Coemansia umbellata]KAJ2622098.1 hypothetical protein GGI26_003540 [Coemansia sp. RSA 1358]
MLSSYKTAEIPAALTAYKQSQTAGTVKCSDIPIISNYWKLQASETPAFIAIPHKGPVQIGGTVCVRVVVPAKLHAQPMLFMPFPNTPWDSILLDLVGNKTGVSVPVELVLTNDVQNYDRNSVHVYEADVLLRDADTYHPSGYIEFRDALWNPDGYSDPQPFVPEPLAIPGNLTVKVLDGDEENPYALSKHLDLPLCTKSDSDGRWVSVNDLPFDASRVLPPDNHNRVWLPYSCRLKPISYADFSRCLVDKYPLIHWFGDSNTRRALKKVTSLGKWCSTKPDINSLTCLCNDNMEQYSRYNSNMRIAPIDMDPINGGVAAHVKNGFYGEVVSNKSRIVAFKWDGLTSFNQPAWSHSFDMGMQSHMGKPTVAIFGLTNWDTAFSTRSFFASEVDRLVRLVENEYSDSTHIVIRTGQYYCCTSDKDMHWKRRYSRLRNRYFDKYLIESFKGRLGGRRAVSVWDVTSVSERRPYVARDEINSCPANHVRSEIVEIENQLLINSMCNSFLSN